MKKIIIAIIIFTVVTGAAYFIGRESVKEVEPEIITIDLSESETLTVIQNARLNWMPIDSAWALAESFAIDSVRWTNKVKWEDKILWSIKDSVRITDSVRVIYAPFFEGSDTVVEFDETVEEIRVQLSLAVKPSFFPLQSKFITTIQMRKLILTKPEEVESFWKHRISLVLGYGVQYGRQTTQNITTFLDDDNDHFRTTPTVNSITEWKFNHGIQLTFGVRLW